MDIQTSNKGGTFEKFSKNRKKFFVQISPKVVKTHYWSGLGSQKCPWNVFQHIPSFKGLRNFWEFRKNNRCMKNKLLAVSDKLFWLNMSVCSVLNTLTCILSLQIGIAADSILFSACPFCMSIITKIWKWTWTLVDISGH